MQGRQEGVQGPGPVWGPGLREDDRLLGQGDHHGAAVRGGPDWGTFLSQINTFFFIAIFKIVMTRSEL